MKNFLIPTTLQSDTISAVKAAISQSNNKDCEIVLMLLSETPDTFSSSQFLREMRVGLTQNQEEVLDSCRYIAELTRNCKIKVHNQSSMSAIIFKGIIEYFSISLVIIPLSYKLETKRIHNYLIQLAGNQKCPILHLGLENNKEKFNKALYIEKNNGNMSLEHIQQFLNENFPLEIVSQANSFNENFEEAAPLLNAAISKYNIDMLVETRKSQKIRFNKNKSEGFNDKLGLPVLSLYEEIA